MFDMLPAYFHSHCFVASYDYLFRTTKHWHLHDTESYLLHEYTYIYIIHLYYAGAGI